MDARNNEPRIRIAEVQHYLFCPRQWALLHLEGEWCDNYLTADGTAMHDRAHDDDIVERHGETLLVHGLAVYSERLGVCGKCDVVELTPDLAGTSVPTLPGTYSITPVEYKRGKAKHGLCDVAQVALQAMCLEDMYQTKVPVAYLYYKGTRHRLKVAVDVELREKVVATLAQIRSAVKRGTTPAIVRRKACDSCSMSDYCLFDAV